MFFDSRTRCLKKPNREEGRLSLMNIAFHFEQGFYITAFQVILLYHLHRERNQHFQNKVYSSLAYSFEDLDLRLPMKTMLNIETNRMTSVKDDQMINSKKETTKTR